MIVDIVYGFLGSGKTTFISHVLNTWGREEKIVVLVNEFGDVGIDGTLLAAYGQRVVELPSGCICCSLQSDFRRQLLEIYELYNPNRVIIEPSGVASIIQIKTVLRSEAVQQLLTETYNILILDATTFMQFYKANRYFFETQIRNADLGILNKCDLVKHKNISLIQNAVVALNPELHLIAATHCKVDWKEYRAILSAARKMRSSLRSEQEDRDLLPVKDHINTNSHHFELDSIGLGYESVGRDLGEGIYDYRCLARVFQGLSRAEKDFGNVIRAKGIFLTEEGWTLFDISSANYSEQRVQKSQSSKVAIIGRGLKGHNILQEIAQCRKES